MPLAFTWTLAWNITQGCHDSNSSKATAMCGSWKRTPSASVIVTLSLLTLSLSLACMIAPAVVSLLTLSLSLPCMQLSHCHPSYPHSFACSMPATVLIADVRGATQVWAYEQSAKPEPLKQLQLSSKPTCMAAVQELPGTVRCFGITHVPYCYHSRLYINRVLLGSYYRNFTSLIL